MQFIEVIGVSRLLGKFTKKSTVYQMVDFIIFLETVNFVNYVHWSQIEDEFHFILYVIKAHLFCASQFIAFPFYCICIKFIFLLQAQLISNRKTIDVLWSLIISSYSTFSTLIFETVYLLRQLFWVTNIQLIPLISLKYNHSLYFDSILFSQMFVNENTLLKDVSVYDML